jgi:WD40 repeat protein
MTAINDPAFAASVSVIKQFLKDQEMFETLNSFEKELSQKNLEFNNLEIPSLLQLTQGFLDLELKECISSKNSTIDRSVGFPVLKDSIKSSASVVSCVCSDSALIIGSTDKVVRIYKDFNNEPIHQIKQDQVVLCMDICNDLLLTSGMAGQTQLFNLKTLEIVFKLKDHTKYVSSCGFSKDGNMFYTGSHDGFLNIYDLDQSEQTQKMSHSKQFKGAIESCCMADDVLIFYLIISWYMSL